MTSKASMSVIDENDCTVLMNLRRAMLFKLFGLRLHSHLLCAGSAADLLDIAERVHNQLSHQSYHDRAGVAPDVDADSSVRTAWEAQYPFNLPGKPASRVGEDGCLSVPKL